jgi:hypothetical protein
MSANAPKPAKDAVMAPPEFADLDELFLEYYEHRFDYWVQLQARLREDLEPEEARPAAARAEAPRAYGGPVWLGPGI